MPKLTDEAIVEEPEQGSSPISIITVDNVTVTAAGTYENYFGIHTFGVDKPFNITAELHNDVHGFLPNGTRINFILSEIEYTGLDTYRVISSPRLSATVSGNLLVINVPKGISKSGNYLISMDRQNRGLEFLNLPFRIEFIDIELDICLNL